MVAVKKSSYGQGSNNSGGFPTVTHRAYTWDKATKKKQYVNNLIINEAEVQGQNGSFFELNVDVTGPIPSGSIYVTRAKSAGDAPEGSVLTGPISEGQNKSHYMFKPTEGSEKEYVNTISLYLNEMKHSNILNFFVTGPVAEGSYKVRARKSAS